MLTGLVQRSAAAWRCATVIIYYKPGQLPQRQCHDNSIITIVMTITITTTKYKHLPISLVSISLSRSTDRPRSSTLFSTSAGRKANCRSGCSQSHRRFSTSLLSLSSRPAISGQFLRRAISNRARIIRAAFCNVVKPCLWISS